MRLRFRTTPSPAVDYEKTCTSDELRNQYRLLNRSRDLGDTSVRTLADQNDIARELERRGER